MRLGIFSVGLAAMLAPTVAQATESDGSVRSGEPAMEVLVVSDPWARWDHTRWRLDTQVGLPYPSTLYAELNHELQIVAYDLHLSLACELGARINKRLREVDCLVEDAAISVAPWLDAPRDAQGTVDETDERLTGMMVRLQVNADGRVTNLNLLDEPQGNRRVNILYENLRQVLSRAIVGFHLQAPDTFVIGEDWTEKNSRLFSLPSFRWYSNGGSAVAVDLDGSQDAYLRDLSLATGDSAAVAGNGAAGIDVGVNRLAGPSSVRAPWLNGGKSQPFDLLQAPASYGRSVVQHRMDRYRGRYLVQSHGEGTVDIGAEVPVTFRGTLDAVSVFDGTTGVMSERVWSLYLKPTAGSALADGMAGWPYWHQGRLQRLDDDEEPELGPSLVVATPGETDRGQLPPWPLF